jgi:hypothetical protein
VGLFDYFRRRRERESAISNQELGSVEEPVTGATQSQAPAGLPGQLDYRKLGELQDSVLAIMKEHGIDPQRPDPTRFTDPEVQRALQKAVLEHGLKDDD